MTAADLLTRARAAGVEVYRRPDGSLGCRGPRDALAVWLPELRARKAELVRLLADPPPLPIEAREAIAESIEERAAIREFDGGEPRATAEHEARVAMRVYNLLIAMPEGPPKWAVMLAPGRDLEQATDDACRRFGADRVLRIEAANIHQRETQP